MVQTKINRDIKYSSLIDLLNDKAARHPHKIAYQYLIGEGDALSISYKELVLQSKRIAALLQSRGLSGKRALIMYPSGVEYITAFFGCLLANVVAVPVYPPTLSRNMDRIKSILVDASTNIILTTSQLHSKIAKHFFKEIIELQIKWICIDELILPRSDQWIQPEVNADTIAFLQYTSGSTSSPKGVMISHKNILYNEEMIRIAFQTNENTKVLGWLPLYHDMGLIGNVLHPLYVGGTSILMAPMDFLQKPVRWLQAISEHRATVSGAPNFAYELCTTKVTEDQKNSINLSSWKVAFNGAEPVRHETLKKFSEEFKICGFKDDSFYPCYGMAEATLFIAGGERYKKPVVKHFDSLSLKNNYALASMEGKDSTALVSCGTTYLEQEIKVVNPYSNQICSDNEIGEIWVNGSNVAKGYFQTGDNKSFRGLLTDQDHKKYLKTGDLGFIHNGQLFITGRFKDVIILKGKNYYPQDIELSTEKSHIGVRDGCSASFSVTVANEERLVIIAEIEREYRPRALNREKGKLDSLGILTSIRKCVMGEHGVQPYCICLIKTGSIPKTSSGKIQRTASKQMYLNEELTIWYTHKKE